MSFLGINQYGSGRRESPLWLSWLGGVGYVFPSLGRPPARAPRQSFLPLFRMHLSPSHAKIFCTPPIPISVTTTSSSPSQPSPLFLLLNFRPTFAPQPALLHRLLSLRSPFRIRSVASRLSTEPVCLACLRLDPFANMSWQGRHPVSSHPSIPYIEDIKLTRSQ
jgi:hypothetical protein